MKETVKIEDIKKFVSERICDSYTAVKEYILEKSGKEALEIVLNKLNDGINTSLDNMIATFPCSLAAALESGEPVKLPEPDEDGNQYQGSVQAYWDEELKESTFELEYYKNVNDGSKKTVAHFKMPIAPTSDTSKVEFCDACVELDGNVKLSEFVDKFLLVMTPKDWSYNKLIALYVDLLEAKEFLG